MIGLSGATRLAAAIAALGVNVALAGGLVSLAHHYGEQAAQGAALAGGTRAVAGTHASAVRCVPEQRQAG